MGLAFSKTISECSPCIAGAKTDAGIILTIIGENERNINDIGCIFDSLKDVYQIQNIYARFDQVNKYSEIKDGKLMFNVKAFLEDNPKVDTQLESDIVEVAVVYFRHGYDSEQYTCDDHWKARETLEVSQAIKCPSADMQLLTFKKVQEVLCKESIWREFNGSHIDDIQPFFKGMYGLEDKNEETAAIIEKAKKNPGT